MPRAKLIRTSDFTYHVTSRSNNREWFYIPLKDCWWILAYSFGRASEKYRAEIHSLVLMSNHFHSLISTPLENIDDIMRYSISLATQIIQKRTGRINHIFGARYRWTVLYSPYALAYVYKYIYRNPVRAEIVSRVEEYPFSTLTRIHSKLPMVEGFSDYWNHIPKEPKSRLNWLNQPTPKDAEAMIGRALKRRQFKLTTHGSHQKLVRTLRTSYGVETEI